jgi:RNA polymerase sigma-70 factor, ECF subfamily
VLLERLAPVERAVFLLHDVFDLDYAEIARIVEKTEPNCRQILARARERVGADRRRFEADQGRAAALLERFNAAAESGDLDGLVALLADDITLVTDGGGKAKGAITKPVHGSVPVAKVVLNTMRRVIADGVVFRPATLNGRPGLIAYAGQIPQAAVIFEIGPTRIEGIYVVANPDKLRSMPRG